ncbi:MAG: ABC transporter ATP-binding protein, partial [Maribacter sp.]|nr:ABC transporter ATP-binding protein [Maribacter sp.]
LFVFRGDAKIEDFPGNYSDFRAYEDSVIIENRNVKNKAHDSDTNKNSWKTEDSSAKLSYLEQKEYKSLEKEIKKLEEKHREIQLKFTASDLTGEVIDSLSIELKEISHAIETKTERWFELSARLEG